MATVNNVYIKYIDKTNAQHIYSEKQEFISDYINEIMMFVGATPRDHKNDEGYVINWEQYAMTRVCELLEEIQQNAITQYKCNLIIEADESEIEND